MRKHKPTKPSPNNVSNEALTNFGPCLRKSPAGFITLEVTAEVRINTKPKIINMTNLLKYIETKYHMFTTT